MKASMLGLVVATVAFGGSSVYLWQQLQEERARSEQVAEVSRRLNARIAELEKARFQLQGQRFANGAFMRGELGPGGPVGPPPAAAPPGETKADAGGETAYTTLRPDRSPAFQNMMRSQIRANNKRLYRDIGDKLGLNKEEAGKLIDLLTDQQLEGFGQLRAVDDPAAARRMADEIHREQQAAISDLIGADKAQSLQEYQESIPARQEFDMLARQLEGNDVTLTADQSKRLLAVYVDERKRVPMPEYVQGTDTAEYGKQLSAWQEDYNKRVSSEASTILNTEQLTAYNEVQQWQKEMREQFAAMPGNAMRRVRGGMATGNVMFTTATPVVSGSADVAVAPTDQSQERSKP
jgi:hypothetical protein